MKPDKIKALISSRLPGVDVYVTNPDMDFRHFKAIVVSPSFEGLSLVKQHQIVLGAIRDQLGKELHSLSIKTFIPSAWESEKHKFELI